MTTHQLRPWSQIVYLHPDVESGNTALATYAIDLGALVRGESGVPAVYRQPSAFFAATYLTGGLQRLLNDVLRCLAGGSGDRVLQLRSPFGGGKSHTLAALYHAARDSSVLDGVPGGAGLPDPGPVRVAVFDGEKFGVRDREFQGRQVQTVWGFLAAQLGCYEVMEYYDRSRGAPGGDEIAEMLGNLPTLILLDEMLQYVERADAEPVQDSTLGRQTQNFLQTLSTEVAGRSHAVLVYSLQASATEAFGNVALLKMLDHLTARVDAKREPVAGDDILPVVRRRLLAQTPDLTAAAAAADTYAAEITKMRVAHAVTETDRKTAQDESVLVRKRLMDAYPFHPALIDIMRERWASIPDFQRTRGALRFLAVCLHALKRDQAASVFLGPGDIPLADADVAQALFTEVGQREPFRAVLQRDFLGPNARIKRIDDRMASERPALSGVNPAMRIATTILTYSFGGPLTPDAQGGDPMARGVTENELLASVLTPDLDSITAQAVLKELREQCLYLHYDGAHYVFKTTPNVTQLIEDHVQVVAASDVDKFIEEQLTNRLQGRSGALIWPKRSQDIPDRERRFQLAYLPLDFAMLPAAAQTQRAIELHGQYGDVPRRFRNGVGLAVPESAQVEPLRSAVRYLKAIERVREKHQQLNVTTAQMEQLKERERTEKDKMESAFRQLYQAVWLPVAGTGGLEIEKVTLSGRPLQATTVHERLTELLTVVSPPRLFSSVTPDKVIDLMALGMAADRQAVAIDKVLDSFYEVLGFPRLDSDVAVLRAIALGVREGKFGYVGRSGKEAVDRLAEGGGYLVHPNLARIGVELPHEEIDIGGAFLVMPEAIDKQPAPGPTPPEPGPTPPGPTPPGATPPGPGPVSPGPTPPAQTKITLRLRMTRQQLYNSFNAIGNLAVESGSIDVTVVAHKPGGFDAVWLRNAVLEPLEEADVEVDTDL